MFKQFLSVMPATPIGRLMFCLILGTLAGGGMGPLYVWPVLLIALSLFWITLTEFSGDSPWKSFAAGWLFGFGYFVFSLYWIGNALLIDGNPYAWAYPLAVCALPAGLALFIALPCYIARRLRAGRSFIAFSVFTVLLMIFEYFRGTLFTGFPWNLFGMTWTGTLPMLQFLAIAGSFGLSFVTTFMFLAPAFAWKGTSSKIVRALVLGAAVIAGVSIYTYGERRLADHPTSFNDRVIVQIIQPGIPQSEKWDNEKVWENYRSLINVIRADASLRSPQSDAQRILVLPETAITYHHLDTPAARDALKGALLHFREPTTLLTGILLRQDKGYTNSLMALNSNLDPLYTFDKFHLVPFGEYIPFQKYIPIPTITEFSGFIAGPGPQTVQIDGIPPFSPLVCYEVIFPGHVTTDNPKRPDWIVNVTNDAWYGLSPGPFQHLAHALYRAIEEGVPVVRSANTGISAVVDPYGRIVTLTALDSADTKEQFLPNPAPQTLYSKLKNF